MYGSKNFLIKKVKAEKRNYLFSIDNILGTRLIVEKLL